MGEQLYKIDEISKILNSLMFLFKKDNESKDSISETYQNIIERSRDKFFYLNLEIDDSFESRFDIIILHSFLIFYYYKELDINKKKFPQSLFDFMFADFDNNLREMGFGDIAVNKKMKVFVSAFYGRISQYSQGLQEIKINNNDSILIEAIKNNLYKGNLVDKENINFFKDYIFNNLDHFIKKSENENLKDRFIFINLNNGDI